MVLALVTSGCGKQPISESPTGEAESAEVSVSEQSESFANESKVIQEDTKEDTEAMMQMRIGDTLVAVEWEDNESVRALKNLCSDTPLTIQMSMYGGFEQVGSIGQSLPRDDRQTTTSSCSTAPIAGHIQGLVIYLIRMKQI